MEDLTRELASYLLERLKDIPPHRRLCVGISGVPGAGKTTLAARIQSHVRHVGIVVPLDGWHLTRSTLATFPDPKLARDRRGAHWTFDANGYVTFMERLRGPISAEEVVTAPSFSHALGDPVEGDIVVRPHHRIVIIEGLYAFLAIDPWRRAGQSLDERWFVAVDAAIGKIRLCQRHVQTGVAETWAEAEWRAENNDIPNGLFVQENMLTPDRVIANVVDPTFVSSA